jgi:hypothetical protein
MRPYIPTYLHVITAHKSQPNKKMGILFLEYSRSLYVGVSLSKDIYVCNLVHLICDALSVRRSNFQLKIDKKYAYFC